MLPPQADNARDKNNPPKINFMKEILFLLYFNPETNRYNAINAKNNPNGSDLNQPINPLVKMGAEIEKNSAAINPALVPPITLTNANTATEVNEPIINGKSIVNSYTDKPEPKIW